MVKRIWNTNSLKTTLILTLCVVWLRHLVQQLAVPSVLFCPIARLSIITCCFRPECASNSIWSHTYLFGILVTICEMNVVLFVVLYWQLDCSLWRMSDSNIIGALDLFVIGGIAGLLLYYFVFRKLKKEVPAFKKLSIGYHELVYLLKFRIWYVFICMYSAFKCLHQLLNCVCHVKKSVLEKLLEKMRVIPKMPWFHQFLIIKNWKLYIL